MLEQLLAEVPEDEREQLIESLCDSAGLDDDAALTLRRLRKIRVCYHSQTLLSNAGL